MVFSHICTLIYMALDSIQVSFSISTLNIPSDTSKYGEAASGLVSKTPNRSRWSSCEYNNNGDEHISLARLQNRKRKWLSCMSQSKILNDGSELMVRCVGGLDQLSTRNEMPHGAVVGR